MSDIFTLDLSQIDWKATIALIVGIVVFIIVLLSIGGYSDDDLG